MCFAIFSKFPSLLLLEPKPNPLSFRDEPMVPDEHEEVGMIDFDPEAERARRQAQYEEEEMNGAGGPGVSCATQ